ncbi:hypothetical protein [Nonomuraea sp. NPDC049141]|uniref:hypothetical protein n=1 Tax=Nonomuraea sp. NPDC049141 TaxID=3155500 RepID=UPI0033CE6B99
MPERGRPRAGKPSHRKNPLGATPFTTGPQQGATAEGAFDAAVEQARYDYGRRGYTGTIAEKDDFVIVASEPMTETEATALADQLLRTDDPRIVDKWGQPERSPSRERTAAQAAGSSWAGPPAEASSASSPQRCAVAAPHLTPGTRWLALDGMPGPDALRDECITSQASEPAIPLGRLVQHNTH